MLTSTGQYDSTYRRGTDVLFQRMSASDHAWYKQQKVFAEAYLLSYITKYRLNGRKFEPQKPDSYARSMFTPLAYYDWISSINSVLLDACLSMNSNRFAEVPQRLETYAPDIQYTSQFKPGLSFNYNPNLDPSRR